MTKTFLFALGLAVLANNASALVLIDKNGKEYVDREPCRTEECAKKQAMEDFEIYGPIVITPTPRPYIEPKDYMGSEWRWEDHRNDWQQYQW